MEASSMNTIARSPIHEEHQMNAIDKLPRYTVLGVPYNPMSQADALGLCKKMMSSQRFHLLVTLGTEMVMNAQENSDFYELVQEADVLVPDGIGLVLASRLAGLESPERVAGVELVKELLHQTPPEEASFFFYGAGPEVAEKAVAALGREGIDFSCAGILDGYVQDENLVLEAIEKAGPTVLLVALGSPRQELFLKRNQERLGSAGVRLGIGVGGSFDVYAGTVERAPKWMQRLHIEWLYRVVKQPSRWRRMLALPRFAWEVLKAPKKAVRRVE